MGLFQVVSSRLACVGSIKFFRLYWVVKVRNVFVVLRFLDGVRLFQAFFQVFGMIFQVFNSFRIGSSCCGCVELCLGCFRLLCVVVWDLSIFTLSSEAQVV